VPSGASFCFFERANKFHHVHGLLKGPHLVRIHPLSRPILSVLFVAIVSVGLVPAGPFIGGTGRGRLVIDKTDYKGWKNNLRLTNGDVELIVTLDVGPRIISFRLSEGKNVFKEFPGQIGKSGEADWQIRGGHRLWVAPEDTTRTYSPDNGPVEYKEENPGQVRFVPAPDRRYGLQKSMTVRLAPRGRRVTVLHTIKNIGDRPTTLAAWALTVLAPGGIEIIPLPPKKPHPGAVSKAQSPRDFAPNQHLSLWPYFDFRDSRWKFGSKYITLKQEARKGKGPTKIGLAHQMSWIAYLNQGTLFVKHFTYEDGKTYPDGGCNFETFTNEEMLEMETLGPLVNLEPGQTTELTERWELIPDVESFVGESGIDLNVLPKVNKE
jgi:hypothetical protein